MHIYFNIPDLSFELVLTPDQFLNNELNKIFNVYSFLCVYEGHDFILLKTILSDM